MKTRAASPALLALLASVACNPWGTPVPSPPPPFEPRLGVQLLELYPDRQLLVDAAPAGDGALCIAANIGAGHDFDLNKVGAEMFVARVDGGIITTLPSPPLLGTLAVLVSTDQCALAITADDGVHVFLYSGSAWREVPPPPDTTIEQVGEPLSLPSRGSIAGRVGGSLRVHDGTAWQSLTSLDQLRVAAIDDSRIAVVGFEGREAVVRTVSIASGAVQSEHRLLLPDEIELALGEARTGTVDAGVFVIGNRFLTRGAGGLVLGGEISFANATLFATPGTAGTEGVAQLLEPLVAALAAVVDGEIGDRLLPGYADEIVCDCDRAIDPTCGCIDGGLSSTLVPVTTSRAGLVIVSDMFAVRRLSVRVLALPQITSPFGGDVTSSDCTLDCDSGSHCEINPFNGPVCVIDGDVRDAQLAGNVRDPTGGPITIALQGAAGVTSATPAANGDFSITVPRTTGLTLRFQSVLTVEVERTAIDATAGGAIALGTITLARGIDLGPAPAVPDARTVIRGSYLFVPIADEWFSIQASPVSLNRTATPGSTVRLIPRPIPLHDEVLVSSTTGTALIDLQDGTLLQGVSNSLLIDLESAEIATDLVALPSTDGSLEVFRINETTLQSVLTRAGPVRALAGGRGRVWIENDTVLALDFNNEAASLGTVASTARAIPVGPGVAVITPNVGAARCEDDAAGCSVEYRDATTTRAVTSAAASVSALATFVVYTDIAAGQIVIEDTNPAVQNPVTRLSPPVAVRRGQAVALADTWILLPGEGLLLVNPQSTAVGLASLETGSGGWRVLGLGDDGCASVEMETCPGTGCKRASVCVVDGNPNVFVIDGPGAAISTCGDALCIGTVPFAFPSSATIDAVHTATSPAPLAPCVLYRHEPGAGIEARLLCAQ